jgi:hypothetical protein
MSHHGDVAQHNDTVALTHLTEGLGCHLPRNLSKPTSSPTVQSRRERRMVNPWGQANSRSVAIRRRAAKDWLPDSTVGHAARVVHEYWL